MFQFFGYSKMLILILTLLKFSNLLWDLKSLDSVQT